MKKKKRGQNLTTKKKDYERIIEEVRQFQRKRHVVHFSTLGRWINAKNMLEKSRE